MTSLRAAMMVGFLTLGLGACGPLIELPGSGEAPSHFQLYPDSLTGGHEALGKTLYMEEISAPGALRSTNIQVLSGDNELRYLGGATWSDRTPRLVGRFMTEALESAGVFQVVGHESVELRSDFRLKTDLRQFAVDVNGPRPVVRVRMHLILVRGGPVQILAARDFESSIEIRNDSPTAIVAGFEDALNELASAQLNWLLSVDLSGNS